MNYPEILLSWNLMLILIGEENYHLLHEQANLSTLFLYAVISKRALLLHKQKTNRKHRMCCQYREIAIGWNLDKR